MSAVRFVWRLILLLIVIGIVLLAFTLWQLRHVASVPTPPQTDVSAASLLTAAISDSAANAEQLRRGQYLVRAGDCISCHLASGGKPFAGGLGMNTPFGVIYTSNISSDKKTGIGDWTPDQFYAAMHDGKGPNGHLYPAFPYPWFSHVSRADDDAILAYLKTSPPVDATPPANQLPFPLNIRAAVMGWNLLYLRPSEFKADPNQSAEWNRGSEIVNGLGHCSGCHTPRNWLGADRSGAAFHGAVLEGFVAPDLTANTQTGLGEWNADDIVEYLKTGRNARAGAAGQMAEVVTYSTSLMTDADLRAIATYLKSLPASEIANASAVDAGSMKRGGQIYTDACASCHLENGVGQPRFFPPLGKNAVVQQDDPSTIIHLMLAGGRVGPSPTRPSPLAMSSFAWKLSDLEMADVATFVRNSWGNHASGVTAAQVHTQRERLGLSHDRLTENSGDHDNVTAQ